MLSPVTSISLTRQMRVIGIQSAIREAGLPETALHVLTPQGEFATEAEAGYCGMDQLLSEKSITAVIGINDQVAFGVLSRLLNSRERQAPRDISVCSFDNTYLSYMAHPCLTTVDYCTEALCKLADDMVLSNSGEESVLKLANEPKLIVRESTGPAPNV